MRIGISVCSSYQLEDPREGARRMLERAQAARAADLDSLFVGDHHVTPSPYYQNVPMLASMLAHWQNKPAGALFLLPWWHPVLLAEQIGTLAAIMEGRFIMQCGLGAGRRQASGMGVELADRVGMFEASLEIMRALWSGERVTHEPYWNIKDAQISPRPTLEVEVWVGATVPQAIERTARMAEGWLASPGLTLDDARLGADQYRDACAKHSRTPSAIAIRRDIYIGASAEDAQRVKARLVSAGYRGIDEAALLTGSVDEVVQHLGRLSEVGYTDVIVRNMSADQGEALACIERLADVKRQLDR